METRQNLLILENDSFAGEFISRSLFNSEFDTVLTQTAPTAMKAFREKVPDCALIDIELGQGPNGIDVAHAFRKIEPNVGILFLTSIVDPRLLDLKGLKLPDNSLYLTKSLITGTPDIINSIHEALRLTRAKNTSCSVQTIDGGLDLTNGQFELIRLIADGFSNKEIARLKFITVKSTENSIARLAKKLDIKDLNTNSQRVMIAKRYFQMLGKL